MPQSYKLTISREAQDDLTAIFGYIATVLLSPDSAVLLNDKITQTVHGLKELPNRYALLDDADLVEKGYRHIVVENYLLVYKVDEVRKRVTVLRVFYGGQNYYQHLS